MTRLLTTTAIGLIVAFTTQVQGQTTQNPQTAQIGGPCQEQWTAVDENTDGVISESEAQAAAQAEFSRIDMDGNGTISVQEWKDCAAPAAIPGGFARTDTGTGTVERAMPDSGTEAGDTADQAMPEVEGQDQQQAANAATAGDEAAEAWGGEFEQMDADDSGDVSAEEAAQWSRSQAGGEQQDEEAVRTQAARFAMLDRDGDATLTEQEWQQRDQGDVEAKFGNIDQDGDGQVSETEWQQHRQQRFEQAQTAAHEEVDLWLFYYNMI